MEQAKSHPVEESRGIAVAFGENALLVAGLFELGKAKDGQAEVKPPAQTPLPAEVDNPVEAPQAKTHKWPRILEVFSQEIPSRLRNRF